MSPAPAPAARPPRARRPRRRPAAGGRRGAWAHHARRPVEGRRRCTRTPADRRAAPRGASRPSGRAETRATGPADGLHSRGARHHGGRGRQRREPAGRLHRDLHGQAGRPGHRPAPATPGRPAPGARRRRRRRSPWPPGGRRSPAPPAASAGRSGGGYGPTISVGTKSAAGLLAGPGDGLEVRGVVERVGRAHARRPALHRAEHEAPHDVGADRAVAPEVAGPDDHAHRGACRPRAGSARSRSQGLSDRAFEGRARAAGVEGLEHARARPRRGAAAAAARSSVPTAVPQGNGARSRRVAST